MSWDREDARSEGVALMAVGAIFATLCGACTWNAMRGHGELSTFALLGLAPIGLGLFFFGKGLMQWLGNRSDE